MIGEVERIGIKEAKGNHDLLSRHMPVTLPSVLLIDVHGRLWDKMYNPHVRDEETEIQQSLLTNPIITLLANGRVKIDQLSGTLI